MLIEYITLISRNLIFPGGEIACDYCCYSSLLPMLQKLIALHILYGKFIDFYAASNNFYFLVTITCFASFDFIAVLDKSKHWLVVLFVLLKAVIIIHYKIFSDYFA